MTEICQWKCHCTYWQNIRFDLIIVFDSAFTWALCMYLTIFTGCCDFPSYQKNTWKHIWLSETCQCCDSMLFVLQLQWWNYSLNLPRYNLLVCLLFSVCSLFWWHQSIISSCDQKRVDSILIQVCYAALWCSISSNYLAWVRRSMC